MDRTCSDMSDGRYTQSYSVGGSTDYADTDWRVL